MPENDKFFSVNIREYLALGSDEEAGEPALVELLSGFSCPKNLDVERFAPDTSGRYLPKQKSAWIVNNFYFPCTFGLLFSFT